jgi:hypothetical protein
MRTHNPMQTTHFQKVPDYLSYYFRDNQKPFQTLTDLDSATVEDILKTDVLWRGDGTYLEHRKRHERIIRKLFINKGGHPKRNYPIYAILGDSPIGPHDLENEYVYKIKLPLGIFLNDSICFTYPDSLYEVTTDDLGRLYLERNVIPAIYTIEELEAIIEKYQVYKYNNHYVEAQIWNDEQLHLYAEKANWIKCTRR